MVTNLLVSSSSLSYVATYMGLPPFLGCPVNANSGGQCGRPQRVPQWGGCCPSVHPMTGQWIPQGQEHWHSQSLTTPMGNTTGGHTPMPSVPATAHDPPTMPFSFGAPHPTVPSTHSLGSTLQGGNQPVGLSSPRVQEQTTSQPTPTPRANPS